MGTMPYTGMNWLLKLVFNASKRVCKSIGFCGFKFLVGEPALPMKVSEFLESRGQVVHFSFVHGRTGVARRI